LFQRIFPLSRQGDICLAQATEMSLLHSTVT
jgi:hypothetical protein